MTYEEAKDELIDIENFCSYMCNCWCDNDWYCPSECDVLKKARQLDFDRIIKCYAKHDGDIRKVVAYINATKINRKRGGY